MNTLFIPFFLFSFLASAIFAQSDTLTINSLTGVTQCLPSLITWTGGKGPYFLPAGQSSATPLVNFGEQNNTSVTWLVALPVGTNAFLQIRDSDGTLGQSGQFTVVIGSSTTCLNSTSTDTGNPTSTSTGGTSVSTGSTSPTSGSVSASSVSGTTGTPKSSSSTSTGAASSKSTAAAASHYAPVGTLAITGAAALALALVL